jgi:hypothetical protein
MAKPATRQGLKDYALRQLGAPVLEINIADEQVDDALDDALQLFYERHFDGVERVFLKYQLTQDDIDRGRARGGDSTLGITTSTTTSGDFEENTNYLVVPDAVLGIERVMTFDNSNVSSGMFSIKYQLFLNDLAFDLGYQGLLNYAMTKSYLEDIDFLLTTTKQIRYNKRNNRLYLDIDWSSAAVGTYVIIECYRIMDPANYSGVYNDSFLKKYFTSLVKKQWGQNLIKFQGVKLPGGIELNGRQIYEDAVMELQRIEDKMLSTYEIPPLDMIG